MSATMKTMELIYADLLQADQLLEGDIVSHNDEFVTVTNIVATDLGWNILITNDFGEDDEFEMTDDEMIRLYVYVE
jgi:hypothetical protein